MEISSDFDDEDYFCSDENTFIDTCIFEMCPFNLVNFDYEDDIEVSSPHIVDNNTHQSLSIDNDIEIINEINENIELQNIKINNIKNYKSTFYKNLINKKDQDTCGICFSYFTGNNKIITLKCAHFFHSKCVVPWITRHKTCPTCREKIF